MRGNWEAFLEELELTFISSRLVKVEAAENSSYGDLLHCEVSGTYKNSEASVRVGGESGQGVLGMA